MSPLQNISVDGRPLIATNL